MVMSDLSLAFPTRLSSGSRKTRIETFLSEKSFFQSPCLSSGSRKTRIETQLLSVLHSIQKIV